MQGLRSAVVPTIGNHCRTHPPTELNVWQTFSLWSLFVNWRLFQRLSTSFVSLIATNCACTHFIFHDSQLPRRTILDTNWSQIRALWNNLLSSMPPASHSCIQIGLCCQVCPRLSIHSNRNNPATAIMSRDPLIPTIDFSRLVLHLYSCRQL